MFSTRKKACNEIFGQYVVKFYTCFNNRNDQTVFYVHRSTVIVLGFVGANVMPGDTKKIVGDYYAFSNIDLIYDSILYSL